MAARIALCLAFLAVLPVCIAESEESDPATKDAIDEAMAIADQAEESTVSADATNAHRAASVAKEAAKVANKVAHHSVHITEHAKTALKRAHDALHQARVNTAGLSGDQKHSLKAAEKKLREATKDAEYGQIKDAKYVKVETDNKKLKKLEDKMDKVKDKKVSKSDSEIEEMRKEIDELKKLLKKKGDSDDEKTLEELEKQIAEMEAAEKKEDKADAKSHDEMKAEIERLREDIEQLEDQDATVTKKIPEKKAEKKIPTQQADKAPEEGDGSGDSEDSSTEPSSAVPVEEKGIDIDTAMPYGDLEPFGREDTAQELTEDSIRESDEMVDQIERAQVAEEKRAVFRALTRLRGAAITSFDGVARSQTGQIDEYNKLHQWRQTHPLHHLADEESDVSKWAFPENADF